MGYLHPWPSSYFVGKLHVDDSALVECGSCVFSWLDTASLFGYSGVLTSCFMAIEDDETVPPNKSLQPTAVGRLSSAIAVNHSARRWLSSER